MLILSEGFDNQNETDKGEEVSALVIWHKPIAEKCQSFFFQMF